MYARNLSRLESDIAKHMKDLMKNYNKYLNAIYFLSIFLTGCGEDDSKARELGFNSYREMKTLQSEGFKTKEEYAKHAGFKNLKEIQDAEFHYIGSAAKYYQYLEDQNQTKIERPANERLDLMLYRIEQKSKIEEFIRKNNTLKKSEKDELVKTINELNKQLEKIPSNMSINGLKCRIKSYSGEKLICSIGSPWPNLLVIINMKNLSNKLSVKEDDYIIVYGNLISLQLSTPPEINIMANKILQ